MYGKYTQENTNESDVQEESELVKISIDEKNTKDQNKPVLNVSTQKVKDDNLLQKEDNQLLFCISVDGSKHAENSFNVITQEFLGKNKMLIVYIYNDKMNHLFNYGNKKETILDNYAAKLHKYTAVSSFLMEDRQAKAPHALTQVYKKADHFRANYLICGYYGIKGPKGDNMELSKGVDFLLANSRLPTMIIKDQVLRSERPSKGYNWLIVMDKQYMSVVNCFYAFSNIINPEKDAIYGLTLLPLKNGNVVDDVQKDFIAECENRNFKNYQYEAITYSKSPAQIITEKINFGTIIFDLLVFYNNREKHRTEGIDSESAEVVAKSNCTICFYSF